MPPVNPENDLKRRARRRLIGAVALALAAVILVPLLLEDEPPPPASLEVRMKPISGEGVAGSEAGDADQPIVAVVPATPVGEPLDEPAPPSPAAVPPQAAAPASAPDPTLQPVAPPPAAPKPVPPPPPKTAPAPTPPPKPAPPKPSQQPVQAQPHTSGFVVQLAALKDAARAAELKQRAAKSGLPVYTDRAGELTRVRVGPFGTREQAVAAAVRLAEIGLTGQILSK